MQINSLFALLSIVNSSIPVPSVFMNRILNVQSFSLLLLIHNSDLCIIPSGYFYLIMLVWYVNCGQHKYVPGSMLMITDWILCSCIILSSRIRFPIYVSSSETIDVHFSLLAIVHLVVWSILNRFHLSFNLFSLFQYNSQCVIVVIFCIHLIGPFRLGHRWLLFVDVVGIVRTVYERERFFIVDCKLQIIANSHF